MSAARIVIAICVVQAAGMLGAAPLWTRGRNIILLLAEDATLSVLLCFGKTNTMVASPVGCPADTLVADSRAAMWFKFSSRHGIYLSALRGLGQLRTPLRKGASYLLVSEDARLMSQMCGDWGPGGLDVANIPGEANSSALEECCSCVGLDVRPAPANMSSLMTLRDRPVHIDGDLTGVTIRAYRASRFGYATWKVLEEKLRFTTKFVVDSSGWLGVADGSGQWTGALGKLQRQEADVCLAPLARMSERQQVADFAIHGHPFSSRMFIRKPKFRYSFRGLTRLFSPGVWLSIAGVLLVCPVLLWGILLAARRGLLEHGHTAPTLADAYHCVFGCMMGQGTSETPRNAAGRVAVLTLLLFGLFVGQFHSSLLMSSLTARITTLPFSSLEEFLDKDLKVDIILMHGSQGHIYSQEARSGVLKKLWDQHLKDRPENLIHLVNFSYAARQMCEERAVLFLPSQTFASDYVRSLVDCEVVAVGPEYFRTTCSIAARKNFPHLPLINRCLQKMLEGGVLRRISDAAVERRSGRGREQSGPRVTAISLEQTTPMLMVFLIGAAVCLVLLPCEMVLGRRLHWTSSRHGPGLRRRRCPDS